MELGRDHVHIVLRLPALLQHTRTAHITGHEETHQGGRVRLSRFRVVTCLRGRQKAYPGHAGDHTREALDHKRHSPLQLDRALLRGAADAATLARYIARGPRQLARGAAEHGPRSRRDAHQLGLKSQTKRAADRQQSVVRETHEQEVKGGHKRDYDGATAASVPKSAAACGSSSHSGC